MDKFEHEAKELGEGYKAAELLHSPILTITLICESAVQACVDVSYAMGWMVYGEQSDADCFYGALRIAYLYHSGGQEV